MKHGESDVEFGGEFFLGKKKEALSTAICKNNCQDS